MNYRKINNITGLIIFVIAAFTYISTAESTASLWDCSEFITSADKLEVGHAPGAPLFMMIGHLFAMFAAPVDVAYMINIFSALCSAFTILFLFWSITHLTRRFVDNTLVIMASGAVGALVYTFSDTFWFSAVEGEVYAASSLITALVFWAILKWEEQADTRYANRWLILIAYITGLSIGVHLLNLLVVPTIVFVYYFKKYKVSRMGIIKTSLVSFFLLALLIWGIIPQMPNVASWFELMFVNSFGLPVNSGLLFFVVALMAALAYLVYYTAKEGKATMNAVMLGLSFCLLGFGSYAMIVIRSSADTPMNQNRPDNIFSLMSYLNREQYGSRPLITGPYYSDANDYEVVNKDRYIRLGNKYVKKGMTQEIEYRRKIVFPRMWSPKPDHVNVYRTYVDGKKPAFIDNLSFFFDYQLGFMYWRYFMWNFVGRQNDMQATLYDRTSGNWISGIKFIDEARLGPMDDLPEYLAKNKGNNKYYFLPLILGLLGLFHQLKKDKKGFTVLTLLFFFTGMAIVIYLNQTPNEPRERDYAYAASFYAYAIWAGMGVACIAGFLSKYLKAKIAAPVALLLGLPAPIIMAEQNWDDHDRSGRYIATDFGYNYLSSCDRNAILYTFGDNDTFPLWYNQEVEGVRTDIKVANSMYLVSDWYYMQMMKRTYDAPPFVTTATPEKIIGETRGYIPVSAQRQYADAKQSLNQVFSDRDEFKVRGSNGKMINIFRSKELILPVNKQEIIDKGLARDTAAIIPYFAINVGDGIMKNKLAALDILVNNFPNRPIYYGTTGDDDFHMGMRRNMRMEGLAYRLVPEITDHSPVNVDKTFDLLVNKFRYRGLNDESVYFDETSRRMIMYYKYAFFNLITAFKSAGNKERMKQLMEKYHQTMPEMQVISSYPSLQRTVNPVIDAYFVAELNDYGVSLAERAISEYQKEFNYYVRLGNSQKLLYKDALNASFYGLRNLETILKINSQDALLVRSGELTKYMESFLNTHK
ncbi:MAG: DUF2723 domain-containing protein [Prevotellaceae bacterium]|jgi:hypothetical protein|nr:DUF2723 domain-containing protein [Prevotellaceae bacterium]